MGLLYRHFYINSSPDTIRLLYLILVRPQLEYAAQLWDPYTHRDIYRLEAVQKFATKIISHCWDSGYDDLLSTVNIPRLSSRRLNLKLMQMYRILHGLAYFPPGIIESQQCYSSRLARAHTVRCPFARTNYYYHSFVPSSIRAWNSLDESQVCASSLHSFKRHLSCP